jgi:hypothetical protein
MEDSVGVPRPAAPSFGDLAQPLLCRVAFGDRLARDRGIDRTIGSQPSPPSAVLGRREAPIRGRLIPSSKPVACAHAKEESARIGLPCVKARDCAVQRDQRLIAGSSGDQRKPTVVPVARRDQPARPAHSLPLR